MEMTCTKHAYGSDLPSDRKSGLISCSKSRSFDHFHTFGVIQLLKESINVFQYDSWLFSWILTALLAPLSVVILCQILVTGPLSKRLAWQLETAVQLQSFLVHPLYKITFLKISENLVANAFCSPFLITFSLLSKACIAYRVACIYTNHQLLLPNFIATVFKLYKRLLVTYLWICLSTVGSISCFALIITSLTAVFHVLGFSADTIFLASVVLAISFCVIFAHLLVICNLATVVSVLEDDYGSFAIMRAFSLIKGRIQVALLLVLFRTTTATLIDGLFHYRVIGNPSYHYSKGMSRIWEAPLLIAMYSSLCLFDSIMNTVFYFTCKSISLEEVTRHSLAEKFFSEP